jgi:hypothetical protein
MADGEQNTYRLSEEEVVVFGLYAEIFEDGV